MNLIWMIILILPPGNVKAFDTPNDEGGSITIKWKVSPDEEKGLVKSYEIFRSKEGGEFTYLGHIRAGLNTYDDSRGVKDGVHYAYKIRTKGVNGEYSDFTAPTLPVVSFPQWFNRSKINILLATIIYLALVIYFVETGKRGKNLFIRKIAGLDALDEAVGRATEMGKPILYVPGLGTMSDVATIAAVNILSPVAKKAAEYNTTLKVPNFDPIVMTVTQQVVKEAYTEAGRPDAFSKDNVFFLTDSQFAYAAGVDGIMVREKPGTNLFMGTFYAESLILAETGNMTGAIQIAGTDAVAQLPFFVAACDFTIIGEELYAASAYLSRDHKLLGSIKAQDWGKIIILTLLGLATVFSFFHINLFLNFLKV